MKIAFDVKGTIEGPKKKFVIALLLALKGQGHEVLVWSNSHKYAQDAVTDNNLECLYQTKDALFDVDLKLNPHRLVDLAVDDDSKQEWLSSRRFLWVHDIPEDLEAILALAESITKESWADTKCQDSSLLSRYM